MEDNYSKAYKEVIEILNFVPKESVDKIPHTLIDTFKAKMDNNYNFSVDINKNFEEQELLDETKAIFANIFKDYWATPYQKERIIAKEKYDRQKEEEIKRQRYNPDSIFTKQEEVEYVKKQETEAINNLPVEVKKKHFFDRLIDFIKRIFNF